MPFQLPPLLVLTGTVSVSGGEALRTRSVRGRRQGTATRTTKAVITDERRAANVIAVQFATHLRPFVLCRTPFGALIDPRNKKSVRALLADVAGRITAFQAHASACTIADAAILERLTGVRAERVATWLTQHENDPEWTSTLQKIRALDTTPPMPGTTATS